MASLVNAVFVLLTMLFLVGLFENLAGAVLGAGSSTPWSASSPSPTSIGTAG